MDTIGIDIGATKINFVLLRNQRVLKTKKISTPKHKKDLIKLLKENILKFSRASTREIKGVGIGMAGPLNKKRDLILKPPNLKCLRNTRLAEIIQRKVKIKTVMENDGNCFTLGEALTGAGKAASIVFGVTLGTGVGGGIVVNKKIYRGAFGSAGEVGHITINFKGPRCDCGNYGCLEAYCSKRINNEYGKKLGIGLANVINLLDPEVIVLGGGIANNYNLFIRETKKEIKKRVISPISKKNVKIKKAQLGDLSGAIGAALLL